MRKADHFGRTLAVFALLFSILAWADLGPQGALAGGFAPPQGSGTIVSTVTGTANQVIVTGTTTPVLSLPQSIGTTSTPTFGNLTVNSTLLAPASTALSVAGGLGANAGTGGGNLNFQIALAGTGTTRTTSWRVNNTGQLECVASGASAATQILGPNNAIFRMSAGSGAAVTDAGNAVTVEGGNGGSTSGAGGDANFRAGSATDGNGGTLNLTGRNAATTTAANRDGGIVNIAAGNPTVAGVGGVVNVTGGASGTVGTPGRVDITGGTGGTTSGIGGAVNVRGGPAGVTGVSGGAVNVAGGLAGDAATAGGSVNFQVPLAGTGTTRTTVWSVNNSGNLVPGTTGTRSIGSASLGLKSVYLDYTNTGTIGAVTINKAAGRVNIAAAAASVVVTNSLVTAASHVFCTISTNDTTAILKNVVPGSGTFTITTTAAVTANTSVDFFVVNAD